MIINIKKMSFLMLLLSGLLACNKEEGLTKAVSIRIAGYNIGNSELEVSIDEVAYDKFRTPANRRLEFAKVYTYPSGKSQASLRIKDVSNGKEVFQQQLQFSSSDMDLFFPYVIINGSSLEIKPPVPDPSTNKLAFYIHYPQSSDAIDIFFKNDAGQISYLAKNVMPSKWTYVDYMTAKEFKDQTKISNLYFTKTGTTTQWAFQNSEQMSKSPSGSLLLPNFEEKGLSRTFFVTPGTNQLEVVNLFKRPN
ncbi:hypothetical protein FA048_15745 [Pedobacter polaris]|uniref:DUF4843 domain-containing protein n=1 Tax=Pedobacter polaris TaxID=2571273 RepID=A0A4V5P243_9SPHI|nr:hypothetical protein [Pedobacter polaris]TKC06656.1 hypothetical protein FA048_15745 [Pedobacter polaris]